MTHVLDGKSLVSRCAACPWYVANTGAILDEEALVQAKLWVERRHAKDCEKEAVSC